LRPGRCESSGYVDDAGDPLPKCRRGQTGEDTDEAEERDKTYEIRECSMAIDGATGRVFRESIEAPHRLQNLIFAASILQAIMESSCGGFDAAVVVGVSFSCGICCLPYRVASAVVEGKMAYLQLCEGWKDSAEIEAAMHYSISNYEGIEHVHGDLESMQLDVGGLVEDVDELLDCDPAPLRLGSGANGKDDDCNGAIDDRDEDVFPPTVIIDAAASAWYSSAAEAQAAVAQAVTAFDDASRVTVLPPVLSGRCGTVTATVTAEDESGNSTSAEVMVPLDGAAPTVLIPSSLSSSCHGSVEEAEAAVLSAAVISDNCVTLGELDVRVESTVTPCALRVRVTATDPSGKSGSDAVTVRVDARPPAVEIERLLLGFQSPACFESVAEAEAAVLAASRVSDDCTANAELPVAVSSSGDPCALAVTVAAGDACSAENSDTMTVRVDTETPVVGAAVATDRLWPANHGMVDVGFSYSVSDNCSAEPDIAVRVTSDERTSTDAGGGGSAHGPDAEVLRGPDGSIEAIRLRAERAGQNGRVYRIEVEATDACGRVGSSSVTVTVPKTPNTDAVDDGQYFDATAVN
jgi:hypothetical protein